MFNLVSGLIAPAAPGPITSALSRSASSNTLLNTDFQAIQTRYQISSTRPTAPIGGLSMAMVLTAQTVTSTQPTLAAPRRRRSSTSGTRRY